MVPTGPRRLEIVGHGLRALRIWSIVIGP